MNVSRHIEENEASSVELKSDSRCDVTEAPTYIADDLTSGIQSNNRYRKTKSKKAVSDIFSRAHNRKCRTSSRKKKRCRFARDRRSGDVQCEVFPNQSTLSEEEVELSWWSNEEMEHIIADARNVVQSMENTFAHEHLKVLLAGCKHDDFKENFHDSPLVGSACAIAESDLRGLEVSLYSPKALRDIDDVVRSVFDQQDLTTPSQNLIRLRSKQIACASRKRSKSSKRLAFALAYGDAIVALS